jgi:hypothetical protein
VNQLIQNNGNGTLLSVKARGPRVGPLTKIMEVQGWRFRAGGSGLVAK